MVSQWPDGAKVIFREEAKSASFQKQIDLAKVYTVRNTEDGLHDVFFEEDGSRWGVMWLTAIDQKVRDTFFDLDNARGVLEDLHASERHRSDMYVVLFSADATSRNLDKFRDLGVTGSTDIAAALRLIATHLTVSIHTWEMVCQQLAEEWIRARRDFEAAWPEYVGKIDEVHHHAH